MEKKGTIPFTHLIWRWRSHLEPRREEHRGTASFKRKWNQHPLWALLSNRDSCPGRGSPVRMVASEAQIWCIRGSERDIDKCFPGLEKESLSRCAALCLTRMLQGQSPDPSGALAQLTKEYWIVLERQSCFAKTAAGCLHSPWRVKSSFQSSCRQVYQGKWGGKEAREPRSRLYAWLLPPKPTPGAWAKPSSI